MRTSFLDLGDDPDKVVAEFVTRFVDTKLFFDPFAGGKFAQFLTSATKIRLQIPMRTWRGALLEEAQLFIEAVLFLRSPRQRQHSSKEADMIPLRTQVKFFLSNADAVDLAAFAPVFQRWIQQKSLEGQLVDVADYRHVFEGPGVVLIGHDSDYTHRKIAPGGWGCCTRASVRSIPTCKRSFALTIRLALTAARLTRIREDRLRRDLSFTARSSNCASRIACSCPTNRSRRRWCAAI